MFTARFPIQFIVRGSHDSEGTFFVRTSDVLLRYEKEEGHSTCAPTLLSCLFAGPWQIDEVAGSPLARIFKLRLNGGAMTELLACHPDNPMSVALLDQQTIELPINMGPIPPDVVGPQVEKDFVATLFIRLVLHVS